MKWTLLVLYYVDVTPILPLCTW